MKAPTSEYRHEAARLRALIAEATTARARQHLEEQVRLNERLATGRPQAARRDVLDHSLVRSNAPTTVLSGNRCILGGRRH